MDLAKSTMRTEAAREGTAGTGMDVGYDGPEYVACVSETKVTIPLNTVCCIPSAKSTRMRHVSDVDCYVIIITLLDSAFSTLPGNHSNVIRRD
jgi:hypothetical protein